MRPAPLALALRLALALALASACALPSAQAALCIGGACAADEGYRESSPACDGTQWVTGAWFASPDLYVYAFGERRDCRGGWDGPGGQGLRIGFFAAGFDAEARWYDHGAGACEVGAFGEGFHAAGPCPTPPPPVAWGNALP